MKLTEDCLLNSLHFTIPGNNISCLQDGGRLGRGGGLPGSCEGAGEHTGRWAGIAWVAPCAAGGSKHPRKGGPSTKGQPHHDAQEHEEGKRVETQLNPKSLLAALLLGKTLRAESGAVPPFPVLLSLHQRLLMTTTTHQAPHACQVLATLPACAAWYDSTTRTELGHGRPVFLCCRLCRRW